MIRPVSELSDYTNIGNCLIRPILELFDRTNIGTASRTTLGRFIRAPMNLHECYNVIWNGNRYRQFAVQDIAKHTKCTEGHERCTHLPPVMEVVIYYRYVMHRR